MNIVFFKEKNHSYSSKLNIYTSVSGLWKPYIKHFDAELISIKKAFKSLDLKNYNDCKKTLSYEHPDIIKMLKDNTTLDIKKN